MLSEKYERSDTLIFFMLFWKISAKWALIIFIGKNISESTIVIDNFLCYFRTHIFVILEKTILIIYPIQNKKQHKTLSIRIIEFYFGEIENRITFYHCNIQNNINCYQCARYMSKSVNSRFAEEIFRPSKQSYSEGNRYGYCKQCPQKISACGGLCFKIA